MAQAIPATESASVASRHNYAKLSDVQDAEHHQLMIQSLDQVDQYFLENKLKPFNSRRTIYSLCGSCLATVRGDAQYQLPEPRIPYDPPWQRFECCLACKPHAVASQLNMMVTFGIIPLAEQALDVLNAETVQGIGKFSGDLPAEYETETCSIWTVLKMPATDPRDRYSAQLQVLNTPGDLLGCSLYLLSRLNPSGNLLKRLLQCTEYPEGYPSALSSDFAAYVAEYGIDPSAPSSTETNASPPDRVCHYPGCLQTVEVVHTCALCPLNVLSCLDHHNLEDCCSGDDVSSSCDDALSQTPDSAELLLESLNKVVIDD